MSVLLEMHLQEVWFKWLVSESQKKSFYKHSVYKNIVTKVPVDGTPSSGFVVASVAGSILFCITQVSILS